MPPLWSCHISWRPSLCLPPFCLNHPWFIQVYVRASHSNALTGGPLAFNYNLIFWPDLTTVTLWYAWNKTSHDIQPEKETFWMDSFSISVSFWLTSQCVAALVSQYYSSPSAPGVQYVDAPKTVQAEWSSASAESVCCQSYAVAVTAAAESGVDEWMVFQTMCLFGKCPHREMHSGIEIGWLVRGLWRGWLRNELLGEEFKKMKINF